MKTERIFQTQQLIDWGIHEVEECMYVVHFKDLGMRSFEVEREVVFLAPDDEKLWRFTYEYNSGAGYDDIVGTSYGGNVKPETPTFTAVEVEEHVVTVTSYQEIE